MCGRFHLLNDHKTDEMARELGVDAQLMHYAPDIAPAAPISFIHSQRGQRILSKATWWLCLDRQTLKPDYRYRSYNSNWQKLNKKASLAYQPYRQSRCIIPASAFCEGLGDKKTYHKVELLDQAIAFGGLYKEYVDRHSGDTVYAVSIVTLAGLPQWQGFHADSMPLILPFQDKGLIESWLDPAADIEQFTPCLTPTIREPQQITPIDRPSKWNPTGPTFQLFAA